MSILKLPKTTVNVFCVLCVLIFIFASGCATSRQSKVDVELIRFDSNRVLLRVCRDEWDGLMGMHGYVGFRQHCYDFKLKGPGPMFVDPGIHGSGSPSDVYKGTVKLELPQNRVELRVREITSKQGEAERSHRHSISGVYTIDETRETTPADRFAFPDSTW